MTNAASYQPKKTCVTVQLTPDQLARLEWLEKVMGSRSHGDCLRTAIEESISSRCEAPAPTIQLSAHLTARVTSFAGRQGLTVSQYLDRTFDDQEECRTQVIERALEAESLTRMTPAQKWDREHEKLVNHAGLSEAAFLAYTGPRPVT